MLSSMKQPTHMCQATWAFVQLHEQNRKGESFMSGLALENQPGLIFLTMLIFQNWSMPAQLTKLHWSAIVAPPNELTHHFIVSCVETLKTWVREC